MLTTATCCSKGLFSIDQAVVHNDLFDWIGVCVCVCACRRIVNLVLEAN